MEDGVSQLECNKIQFQQFLDRSRQCKIKIIGTIKSVFSSRKYIIEVYFNDQVLIRTIKKYAEFEATYQVIKMKFQNFDLGTFPSKYQVFHKDETRKQYFEDLLNKIVQNYIQNPQKQACKRLVSIIYLFMTKSLSTPQKLANEPKQQSELLKKFQRKRKLSLNQESLAIKQSNVEQTKSITEQKNSQYLQYSDQKEGILTQCQIQRSRVRRNSDGSMIQVLLSSETEKQKAYDVVAKDNQRKINQSKAKKSLKETKYVQQKKYAQLQIKFQNEIDWKKRYLKIENSCLLIFKDKMENSFKNKIQLYRIHVEHFKRDKNAFDIFCQKMEINNQPTFAEDQTVIVLFHDYDYQKILIKGLPFLQQRDQKFSQLEFLKNEHIKLQSFKEELIRASQISPIKQRFEGVFNPIGKIFLIIHKLGVEKASLSQRDILQIKVRTTNLQYECKKVVLKEDNTIKQGFFIPISNSFETIQISAVVIREEGWIREQFKSFSLGYCQIQFSELITNTSGYRIQKREAFLNKDTQTFNEYSNLKVSLQYSIQNYSHFSSIYSDSFANQNDGKIMLGLKLEDIDELSITQDRALRIIGNVALFIISFWRNVYLFKYPRLGRIFFILLLSIFLFVEIKIFVSLSVMFLIALIFYHHPSLKQPLNLIFDYLLFCEIHPHFIQPLCLGTTQIKYRKWCQALEDIAKEFKFTKDNRLQKKQLHEKLPYVQYRFLVHQKTFIYTEQIKGFFSKVFEGKRIVEIINRMVSGVANTLQKASNLFVWVDIKRSLLLLFLLTIFSGIANDFLLRIIGTIFCVHRLYKGMSFYKHKHYKRNRKISIFTLRYILNKSFNNLIGSDQKGVNIKNDKKTITSTNLQELDRFICDLQFPIGDEGLFKKMKAELQKLICVYIDINQLSQQNFLQDKQKTYDSQIGKQKQRKKSQRKETEYQAQITQRGEKVKLQRLVRIIQSCETRLSLEWVAGKQGLTNEYQQLRELTKQVPYIDVWLQNMVVNFVLNIPSQLFIKLKSQKMNGSANSKIN